jgi:hypothetical protein
MSVNNVEKDTDKRLLEFLIAEFETTFLDPNDPRAAMGQEIVKAYKENKTYSKSDLYKLDTLILSMQPTERLVQRAEALRLKYFDLAGTKIANAYRPTPLPTPDKYEDKAARNLLLADLQHVLRFIHWGYFFIPIREKIRTDVIISASFWMLFATGVWAFFLFVFMYIDNSFLGLLITVMYAGLMGGFISSQRRMQMIPTQGDPLSSIYELENGKYFSWFAPLTGAVFSVILMLLFISGVVSGSIFPKFNDVITETVSQTQQSKVSGAKIETGNVSSPLSGNKPDQIPTGEQSKVSTDWNQFETHPINVANYALLIIWSFIAGFAERFVPDALDRLISRGASTEVGGRSGAIRSGGVSTPSQITPQVKAIQPTTGPASGGTPIYITGSGFKGDLSVNFGSTPATSFTVTSDTLITAISPAGKGLVNVTVTTTCGTSQIDSASQFTYDMDLENLAEDEGDTHLCDLDVPIQDITSDEELPIAKGGVA